MADGWRMDGWMGGLICGFLGGPPSFGACAFWPATICRTSLRRERALSGLMRCAPFLQSNRCVSCICGVGERDFLLDTRTIFCSPAS